MVITPKINLQCIVQVPNSVNFTLGVLIQTNECVNVPFHEVFLNEIISNARKFYFQHLLVRIVDDFIAKRLTLCQEYDELCNSI